MAITPEPGERLRKRVPWRLTPEAFDNLLNRLAVDREEAAREFEELRRFLTMLLTYAGAVEPERLADTTLDRAAKRLAEGERIENLRGWLLGAARKVLHEARHDLEREAAAVGDLAVASPTRDAERDHLILRECLDRLPPASRDLIERYYQTAGERLVAARKRLAENLGISSESPRTKALRLRKDLEKCFSARADEYES